MAFNILWLWLHVGPTWKMIFQKSQRMRSHHISAMNWRVPMFEVATYPEPSLSWSRSQNICSHWNRSAYWLQILHLFPIQIESKEYSKFTLGIWKVDFKIWKKQVLGPRVDFEVGSSSRVCCVTQPKNCRTQNISRLLWEICVILMKQWVDITHLMAEYCEKPFFFRRLSHWTWLLPGRISWLDWRLMMVVYIYI